MRSLRVGRVVRLSAVLLAAGACCGSSLGQDSKTLEMPMHRRWGNRVLVADLGNHRILMVADLNGDGRATGPGEVSVFFDSTNLSGLGNATGSVFSMYQAADGRVYIGEGDTDSVYVLRDNNLDGDALDAGEAQLFYSAGLAFNPAPLPTPNGLAGDAASIYVSNAGTGSAAPVFYDNIWRLTPSSQYANFDALDAGEASVFADCTSLYGGGVGTGSNPFDLAYLNGALYLADFRSAAAGRAFVRFKDTNNDGVIGPAEWNVFTDASNTFGVPLSQTIVTDGTSLFVHQVTASQVQTVWKLTDLNNNGVLDAGEATEVWSEANLPTGEALNNSFSIAVAPKRIAITSNGGTPSTSQIIVATDLNGNGRYDDPGEFGTLIKQQDGVALFPSNVSARRVIFYGWPCPGDFNQTGGVELLDIFAFLNAWFANDPRADMNGTNGVDLLDIFVFLNRWFAGC